MAMTQRSRSALYEGLSDVIADRQAVEEMLAYFPSRDVEEPVTKDFLRAELADVSSEVSHLRGDLRAEMAALRTDVEAKFNRMLFQLLASMAGFVSLVLVVSRIS